MTKDHKHLNFSYSLKFNRAQIKLNSKKTILIQENHIGSIFSVTNRDVAFTSSRGITRKKLSPK